MPTEISNIKAYSEQDGLDKVAALSGEYDADGGSVTIFQPYEILHGGPAEGELFTIAYDEKNVAVTLKDMKFDGVIPRTESLFFIPASA
ncbi:MAG: hypothetical protein QNJ16_06320 [Rhodobacter sp.]|nr:hypothetical protein [Rhodobacter sp.]